MKAGCEPAHPASHLSEAASARTAADASEAPTVPGAFGAAPARILAAGDNADLRRSLQNESPEAYEIRTAADGEAALADIRENLPDLVLADIVMPRLNGFKLLKALRADPVTRGIPVLLISARTSEESRLDSLEAGADDYLIKPFSADELRARVRNLVKMKRVRDLLRKEAANPSEDLLQLTGQLIGRERELQRDLVASRESAALWRGVFESAAAGLSLADLSGRFQAANPAQQKLLGYSEDELRQLSILDVTHEDDRSANSAMFMDVVSRKRPHCQIEKRYLRKDGSAVWANVRMSLISNIKGEPQMALAVTEDIGERKRSEAAYLQLAAVVESSDDAIISKTLDGVITSWNRGAERIYGYSASEVTGKSATLLFPSRNADELRGILERVQRGEGLEHYETRQVRKDGIEIDVSLTISPMKNTSGEIIGACVITRDITELKKAAEELQAAQAQVAHMSRATTMGELAASIAHEVNQPLGAIVTNGYACLRWLNRAEPNLEEVRAAVDAMVRQGERAGEVIQKIRSLLGNRPPQMSPVDMNELVNEVLILTRNEIVRRGVAFRTELAPDLPVIKGDSVQLQQVLLNLILNALEAMSASTQPESELLITSQMEGPGRIGVAVHDSGVGIDTKNMDRLFRPFYTTKAAGMGMGLSISRSIIEAHGGRLWAMPNTGPGATFHFWLPAGDL
jgi:PAS domain S-box-containing protein